MASFGQHRRTERSQGGAVGGGEAAHAGQAKVRMQFSTAKRDNKRGSRLLPLQARIAASHY